MTILFLLSAGFIVYTYLLFPLILHLRAKGAQPLSAAEPAQWPSVSIVIAAHNEAANLPAKLASLRELDYPVELIELIIVSDGSTDGTDTYLEQQFAGNDQWKYKHLPQSLGKCGALNEGVAMASGDIILFMDGRQRVSSNAMKLLIPYLLRDDVGAASGELILSEDGSLEAGNFGLYWRYEKWIRDNESRLFSTTGVTGALYAIRRAEFKPNRIGTLLDDFDTPVGLLKHGKRTLFIPGAYAFDKAADDIKQEFGRKVRNLAGNWQSYQTNPWLFNPFKNPVWWQFLSHKVFRLLVPYALIIAFITAAHGQTTFLNIMFVLQIVFYALALANHLKLPGTSNKVMNMINVFLQLNAAAFVATFRYFASKRAISWR